MIKKKGENMLTEERKTLILEELDDKNSATIAELAELLKVSPSTVRRVIIELSRE